ncbi:MAG: 3-oxoacyl-ACP reductase, partial [Actinomycetia bacterium]|nr:3-oxoacyl-ACP reductase [Actinomycetes bacterium]
VVTGGGDGIGGAIGRLFAQHGAAVELAEVDPERAERAVAEITAAGGDAHATVIDVRDVDAVNEFAAGVLARRGRVDVLVNNVGDFRPLVRFEQSTPESWQDMFDINFRHVLAVTRAFIGPMREQRRGSIVNFHSVEGMRGYPGEPVYGAFKAAVAHFTTNLAVRYGRDGIRANGIGPDLTQTPQVDYLTGWEDHEDLWPSWAPVGRLGWPEDQARVALFLASDMSGFITGHNIPVDGGTKAGGGWFYSPTEHRFANRPRGL